MQSGNKFGLLDRKIKNLYEDKLNGIISTEMFIQISKEYEKQKNELELRLDSSRRNEVDNSKKISGEEVEKYVSEVLKFDNPDRIDRSILIKLINKIIIENKKIKSIEYNFSI